MLDTYNCPPMSLSSINFLHLTVSEISPGQDFIGQGHYGKVKGQIKIRPWRCPPTPPNQCPYQVSTSYTLRFLRYSPDKLFPAAHPTAHPDTMGKNNTLTALKGCGVKISQNRPISEKKALNSSVEVTSEYSLQKKKVGVFLGVKGGPWSISFKVKCM